MVSSNAQRLVARAEAPVPRGRLDAATVLGLLAGIGMVAAGMAVSGSLGAFYDTSSLLIVLGGTLAVTIASSSTEDIAGAQRALTKTVWRGLADAGEAARHALGLAEAARKNGALALQPRIDELARAPFAARALSLAVDGAPPEEIERVLRCEIDETARRHGACVALLRRAAETAPAMGLLGTLIGLVQMLGRLDDPAAIGPGMALALVTTFYGAILSTLILSPLAAKLERASAEEATVATIYLLAAASISRRESPHKLETAINAALPPLKRVNAFD